jgi:hypothetical protein
MEIDRRNQAAPVRLYLHLCLNWDPRCLVPHLITLHILPSSSRAASRASVPLISIAPRFPPAVIKTWHCRWADKVGEQGEQSKDRVDE